MNLKTRFALALSLAFFVGVLTWAGIAKLIDGGFVKTHEQFQVTVKVDFGPAKKSNHEEVLMVENGTTPKEAVSRVFPIRSGMACCSLKELIEIGGVAIEPSKNRWWICSINGTKKLVSPHQTRLKAGDVVEWKYVQQLQ